jgi:GT2 family glycosyltransferase
MKIASVGNIGFARAMNRLLKAAFDAYGADAVITANPDGVFHCMTINRLTELAAACPEALIEAIQFPAELSKDYDPVTLDTPWASWCCVLLPRVIYETVGPLDEHFFMYVEDVDYSWRARLAGFGVKLCVGGLYAHHNAARRYEEPSELFMRYNLESARYLGWKWGNLNVSRYCERMLVAKGFYASRQELPGFGEDAHRIDDPRAARIACFDKPYFSWGKVRW